MSKKVPTTPVSLLVLAAALAALSGPSSASTHVIKNTCRNALTTQPKTQTGHADRVYRAPHGCVWVERFSPSKTRTTPYKINVRVHSVVRTLTPPMPQELIDPEFSGFCGPHNLIVQWPFVIYSAGQRLPAGAGRFVCGNEILWIAQINQYATRAWWQTFRAQTHRP